MISDVLSEARHDIKRYMRTFDCYSRENMSRADYLLLESCLAVMDATQTMLDTPPIGQMINAKGDWFDPENAPEWTGSGWKMRVPE